MNQTCYKCNKPNKNENKDGSSSVVALKNLDGSQRRPVVATKGGSSNVMLTGDASRAMCVNLSRWKRALRGAIVAMCRVGCDCGRHGVLERSLKQTDKRAVNWLPNRPNSGRGYCSPGKKVAHRCVCEGHW